MTNNAAKDERNTPTQQHTPADLKAVAELLSDEARKLCWRLGERFETALTLPDDQAAYDELYAEDLADLNAGGLARLSETGRMLNDFLGPYRPGKDDALVPNLKPPADPEEIQAQKRKAAEAEAEAAEKAAKDRERAAAKEETGTRPADAALATPGAGLPEKKESTQQGKNTEDDKLRNQGAPPGSHKAR